MNDSERERIIDKRVMARLATDKVYLNAANAQEAEDRELEIARQESARLLAPLRGTQYTTDEDGSNPRDLSTGDLLEL